MSFYAGINIDAKLIRNDRTNQKGPTSTSDLADTVELANGCACELNSFSMSILMGAAMLDNMSCSPEAKSLNFKFQICCKWVPYISAGCSIQDELFSSFEQLLSIADRKGVVYDRYRLF